ncbi:SDR1 dehydrogenase, partial [Acromyrmex insinuator]
RRMERWNGKVAVVTGASAGIGAAIVRNLVKQGMIVAGFARRVEKIKEIADCLKDSSDKLHAVECDVTKEESVTVAFAWVKNNLGPISVLVNSAGIIKESSLIDGTLEDWRSVFDVNVLGLCLCTREAVRMMRETADEDAIVIHVNSLAAERVPSVPGFSVYPASKRAITGLAMTLRHELAGTRIRVTNISPGLVATKFMASYSVFSPETMAAMPVLNPDDVAAAVIYVLSNPPHVLIQDVVLRPLGESCMNTLTNKIALVTGACSGIGKAVTEELVSKGFKVIDLSNDINKLKLLVDELKDKSGKLYPLQCDLSLPNEIESASEWIEKNLGSVDILVNSANINDDIQEFKKIIDINLLDSLLTKKILQLKDKSRNICPGLMETELNQQWLKENSRLALKPKDVADAILCSGERAYQESYYYTHSGD